ncbi:ATPase family gene 2 protein homolog A isoform X2 [Prorops nasuta]|uniref:ATPase family gene 2 protein homolog A isoform X2 n=1 Tax=Prorops nasuta TaxID=863751 RepID=UPI0034CF5404
MFYIVLLKHTRHKPALQLCDIGIGDSVIINAKNAVVIKIAWPTSDKTLLSVSLTKSAIELYSLEGPIMIKKLDAPIFLAAEFTIRCIGKHSMSQSQASTELYILIKNFNEGKIFACGNKISIPYYGKKLIYEIVKAISEGKNVQSKESTEELSDMLKGIKLSADNQTETTFYKAMYSTKWVILDSAEKEEDGIVNRIKYKIEDIGGYDHLIQDIKDIFDIGFNKCKGFANFHINKGILLYGSPGVGKSMMAQAIISTYNVHFTLVHSLDIYSKSIGETERKLAEIFDDAKSKAPSIILIEDIDTLCPKRSTSSTDHERRVLATLVTIFDELQSTCDNVFILATSSKPDFVDTSLRRPGRLDKEFEIYVPDPNTRIQILKKLLLKVPNDLSEDDIQHISFITHGFVGADLYGLCSEAIMSAVKRGHKGDTDAVKDNTLVTLEDFNNALKVTKPSAMKEVLVEVPNVKWTDVGGQKTLKLKLKQAVEWPLRHPEAFVRMGIKPPRGVLMFGPPGCSKTMIAKALATESKVNFLNIKGPELFSKWVGESEKAVRDVFRKARQVAPSIIFIDEIDAIGGERSSGNGNGSSVQERVLAQLLTELDGVTALGDVTLVAATNRPDRIDKALLRPGRLDRIIYVPLPNFETRQEIFEIKLRNMPVNEDVIVQDLVELTDGYSGAEIQAICDEAAMKALEEDLDASVITKEHFKAALSIVTPRTPVSLIKLYDDYIEKGIKTQ